MPRYVLGRNAVRKIHGAVEALFARAKARFLGRDYGPRGIVFRAGAPKPVDHREDLSLGGIYDASVRHEGMTPSENVREALNRVAEGYLDAHQEHAKAQVVHAVQAWMTNAEHKRVNTDLDTVLGGELAQLMGKVAANVKHIVDTEANRARNTGSLDVISKVNAAAGVADPVVYFVISRDQHVCGECLRLHQLDGTLTGKPRVWRLSEVGAGYHKQGDDHPKLAGLHPHCCCSMVTLMPGFGFDEAGKAVYIGEWHDEYKLQRTA